MATTKIVALVSGLILIGECTSLPQAVQIGLVDCYTLLFTVLIISSLISDEKYSDRFQTCFRRLDKPWLGQQLTDNYEQFIAEIARSLRIDDPLFKKLALHRLQQVDRQSDAMRQGVIEYYDTESWRLAYEVLLRDDEVKRYRSVALVNAEGYWQDVLGRQSLELNYELQTLKSLSIERIVIIADNLWPKSKMLPVESIADWVFEQHNHGIWVELVRASRLEAVPELLADIGIYGEKALGKQLLDSKLRTMKFSLSFNQRDLQQGIENWRRLQKHATSVRKLLDQRP